ncbi:MAG: hypothetical protein NZX77_12845 [Polyangiaceae bacterium]|nr:hypothetical protein [Polyangiaceae bacterium]
MCLSGKCGVQPRPKGYTPEDKTAEDCLRGVCDGKGGEELVFDKTDPPKSNSACFSYICEEGGSFTIVHAPAGTSCGEGCFCNGKGNYGKCIPGTSTCEDSVLRQCKDGVVVETLCKEELPSCSEGACRGVLQLAAGGDHSCAMLTNQRVHCWGRNHVGQLGIGTNHPTQTQYGAVVGLTGVLSVAAGDHHTCAIVEGGKVFCWGDNEFGQVGAGPGAPEYYTVPIEVKGLSGVTQLGLGHGFSCALTVTGQVHCWGKNDRSQMDAGWSTPNVLSPKQISIESADQLAVGRAHACVLTKIGSVVCWGSCESWQTVGSPSSPCGWSTQKPLPVEGLLPDVVQIQAGGDHTCALSAEGVQCWGRNDRGQLGVKKSSEKEPPTLTSFPKPGKVAALALGMNHTCLLSDGTVSCVGWNNLGQLGRGYLPTPGVHPEFEATPGLVVDTDHALLHGITQISARTDFTLARKNDGNLFGWGNGQYGKSIGPWFLPDPVAYQFAVHIWYVN